MDRCSPSGMTKCYWKELNPHPQFFQFFRVFMREHLSILPGSLSRALLADVASLGQVSAFLGTPVPDGTMVTERSNFGIACSVTSVGLASSSLLQSPFSSASRLAVPLSTTSSHGARDRGSRSPFFSLISVARAPRRTQTPWSVRGRGMYPTWIVRG